MTTKLEYMQFFTKWIRYQYSHSSDWERSAAILCEVDRMIDDDKEAAYWSGRDCWTMHDRAVERMPSVETTALSD
jgi:hypothetical protein